MGALNPPAHYQSYAIISPRYIPHSVREFNMYWDERVEFSLAGLVPS